jgi:hypothetical protein
VAFQDHVGVLHHPHPFFQVQQAFQAVFLFHLVFPAEAGCLMDLALQEVCLLRDEARLLREALQGRLLVQLVFQLACLGVCLRDLQFDHAIFV